MGLPTTFFFKVKTERAGVDSKTGAPMGDRLSEGMNATTKDLTPSALRRVSARTLDCLMHDYFGIDYERVQDVVPKLKRLTTSIS